MLRTADAMIPYCHSQIQKVNSGKQDVFYLAVFEGIEDYFAVSSLLHYICGAKKAELMRAGCLVYAEDPAQISHAHFAYRKCADDFCSRYVATRGEELRKGIKRRVSWDIFDDSFFRLFIK